MSWIAILFLGLEVAVAGYYCSTALEQIAKHLREIAYQMEVNNARR